MTSADEPNRFLQNPAREVEELAAATVRQWVGVAGEVIDTSDGHDPDFRIEYHDGRVALGEVAWHADPAIQEMWANTHRSTDPQIIELEAGAGLWSVQLARGASIKRLHKELPGLVQQLITAQREQLIIYGGWPRDELATAARALGIERVAHLPGEFQDVAYYALPWTGGVVPLEADVIVYWLESVLKDPRYHDTTAKLLAREADERHVFVMSGTATVFGAEARLQRLDEALPQRSPRLPEGITHIWAAPAHGEVPLTAMWTAGDWVAVPLVLAYR